MSAGSGIRRQRRLGQARSVFVPLPLQHGFPIRLDTIVVAKALSFHEPATAPPMDRIAGTKGHCETGRTYHEDHMAAFEKSIGIKTIGL
jgi:hypothetical protein